MLKIDCPMVEKILVAFIKDSVRKNGFRNAIVGVSGGLDSAVVLALCAQGPGRVAYLRPAHALPHLGEREPAPRQAGLPQVQGRPRGHRRHARRQRLFRPLPRRQQAAGRQQVRPRADVGALRLLGAQEGAGGRHVEQERAPGRLFDPVRRFGRRLPAHRRPVQDPGLRAGAPPGRPRGDHRQEAHRPTCGPARPTRARSASPTRTSTSCCT